MKIFDTRDIREIDAFTIAHEPVSSVDLMERAATACLSWICRHFSGDVAFTVFTGPGNNGGDGWAIARLLSNAGFKKLRLYHLQISPIISGDASINRDRLTAQSRVPVQEIKASSDFPIIEKDTVIIDALFGSGLSRPLEGLSAGLVKHLNHSGCRIISIDIPSGLMGEDNAGNSPEHIIRASETLTFQFPKRSFFFGEHECYTGNWHILPINLHPDSIADTKTLFHYSTAPDILPLLKKRKRFSHKGTYGHALLIAGSYGMMGAAILAARACMRAGAGLLTTHVPHAGYPIIQAAVPESIFSMDNAEKCFSHVPSLSAYTAIGAGPGIGTSDTTSGALGELLRQCQSPLVLDADALNILSVHHGLLPLLPENTILTPHPGEFERLTGTSGNGYQRNQKQIAFSREFKLIVVLKGHYTSITFPDGNCYFNGTGNPGMATAGSGDVLTGIILSLLAQGYRAEETALMGTFLHGLAGDLAAETTGQQALIASDIIGNIGNAFNTLQYHELSKT